MTDICQHCDRRIRRNAGGQWITNIGGTAICVGNLGGHESVMSAVDMANEAMRKHAEMLGNKVRISGCDRCYCGCKYWVNDACTDCGGTVPMPDDEPTMSVAQFLYEVGPSLGWKNDEE
jgi:aldehyde:ferredoxin oxidoreductase